MIATLALLLAQAMVPAVTPVHNHAGDQAVSPASAPAGSLEAQLATLRRALVRYRDFEVVQREGWKKFGGDGPLVGEHWYLPPHKGGTDYRSGQPLDFSRPSSLMYTDIAGRKVLTGVTFNVRLADGEPVPQGFAGPADVWHVHDFRAFFAAALRDRPAARRMAQGVMKARWGGRERLAMIHVWAGAIANPDGVFAHYNRMVPYLKLGLPPEMAEGASLAAARGLNLATPNGCSAVIDGALRMAGASADSGTRLHRQCQAAAAHVREGLKSGRKAEVNAMAEHGWAMFDSAWNRELTADQKARIAAITEHGNPVAPQGPAHSTHQ